jgi:AcrR family transcriptional regulator
VRLSPDARRALILSAAAAMFQKQGYAATSIDAIAAAAGISGPGIYRYFSRKTELLLALLEAAAVDAVTNIEASLAASSGQSAVAAMAAVMADCAAQEGAVIGLLQSTVVDMEADDRARLDGVRTALVARLTALLCHARPALGPDDARVHIEAALSIVGQIARRKPSGEEEGRYRHILRAVLAA